MLSSNDKYGDVIIEAVYNYSIDQTYIYIYNRDTYFPPTPPPRDNTASYYPMDDNTRNHVLVSLVL